MVTDQTQHLIHKRSRFSSPYGGKFNSLAACSLSYKSKVSTCPHFKAAYSCCMGGCLMVLEGQLLSVQSPDLEPLLRYIKISVVGFISDNLLQSELCLCLLKPDLRLAGPKCTVSIT